MVDFSGAGCLNTLWKITAKLGDPFELLTLDSDNIPFVSTPDSWMHIIN